MPLREGISEMVEAIEGRIEVTGHAPTWRVTGGSFESALEFVHEAYDDPVVIARDDRDRWWPRVTLTVTTDPDLAAQAPPLEELASPRIPLQTVRSHDDAAETDAGDPHLVAPGTEAAAERPADPAPATLDEFFADQERSGPAWRLRDTVAPVLLVALSAAAVALVVLLFLKG